MKRALQKSSRSRLAADRKVTPAEALQFLEDFRQLMEGNEGPSKLISIRVPERLLRLFRSQCDRAGRKYQSQILELMRQWVASSR
ncbi:MAG: hypothetical protein RJB38_187 [Pseudomonadota bacterium]|jgi:uncharacterized protein (DUF4415 family)